MSSGLTRKPVCLAGVLTCTPGRTASSLRGGAGLSPGLCAPRDRSALIGWLSILAARIPRHSIAATAEQYGWAAGLDEKEYLSESRSR